jgi:hypothetical protein
MSRTRHRVSTPRRVVITVAATVAGLLLGVGSAVAYWTATGTGSGTAAASTFVAPTVAAGNASAQLYPGGTGDLVVTATNTNPFPVTVTVAQDTTKAVTGCTTPAVTFSGGSFTLPPSSGAVTRTLAGAVSMGPTGMTNSERTDHAVIARGIHG